MLLRPVQNALQSTASRYSLVLMPSFIADFVTSAVYTMLLSANSLTRFSVHVDMNAMISTLKLVTVLHLSFRDLAM